MPVFPHRRAYIATFAISCATLAMEIILTRILSVITWYYMAYFAISLAMLGMTAGAIAVYFRRDRPAELADRLALACLGFAWTVPVSLVLLCLIPLYSVEVGTALMNFLALGAVSLVCAVPFFFSGVAITTVLTRLGLPVGRIYAADLAGAAFACVLVLIGFEAFDPYTMMLLCGALGGFAAWLFAAGSAGDPGKSRRRLALASAVAVGLLAYANFAQGRHGLRPLFVKDRADRPDMWSLERWNSYSQVVMGNKLYQATSQMWGASPKWQNQILTEAYPIRIDAHAATGLRRFESLSDLEHLRYDVPNIGYYIGRRGQACIIGVGAGRDAQSAILFGHSDVVAVDVNSILVDLVEGEFGKFSGLAGRPGVRLVADEARSYFSRHPERCAVLQMSMTDTWAATAAGAYSLSENSLYTLEAWKVFFSRLADDGLFFVSRWYAPENVNEVARIVMLAMATLLDLGVADPALHIALIGHWNVGTLVVGKAPLSAEDLARLGAAVADLQFTPLVLPGTPSSTPLLQRILEARSRADLARVADDQELDISPPTDENPYFFNMLRLRNLRDPLTGSSGAIGGNLRATQYLLGLIAVLLLLVFTTIVVPLWIRTGGSLRGRLGDARFRVGASYFALIGAGFMFLEVALIQRLNLYLGHPTYALSVILFTLILSTGCGSYLSERVVLGRGRLGRHFPLLIAAAVVVANLVAKGITIATISWQTPAKIALAIGVLFPAGMALGIAFPLGMRLVRAGQGDETPWYWALNGVFGVLSSCLAVLVSIYLGISVSFWIATACYLALTACTRSLIRESSG